MAPCASATKLQRSEQQRKAEHTVRCNQIGYPAQGREETRSTGGPPARRKRRANSGWDTRRAAVSLTQDG
eukprot:618675-Alexandrium_andersonii.AAC.1